jgi:hypothetical protein
MHLVERVSLVLLAEQAEREQQAEPVETVRQELAG